jgi:hypothetical protein
LTKTRPVSAKICPATGHSSCRPALLANPI